MTGAGFSWTTLRPSRERRSWLIAATALTGAVALALLAAAAAEPSIARYLAVGLCVLATAVAAWSAWHPPRLFSISIGADGAIWARDDAVPGDATTETVRLRPTMVGTRLVSLSGAEETWAIWRDSLPPDRFRQLCAHARWHVDRTERPVDEAATLPPVPAN